MVEQDLTEILNSVLMSYLEEKQTDLEGADFEEYLKLDLESYFEEENQTDLEN